MEKKLNPNYGRKFEDSLNDLYYRYGLLVGRFPWIFLIFPLILTAILSPGIIKIQININLYELFVPYGAPVKNEFERSEAFKKIGVIARTKREEIQTKEISVPYYNDIFRIYVLTNDQRNVLNSHYLGLLYNISKEMLSLEFDFNGKVFKYTDFCRKTRQLKCTVEPNMWLRHAELIFRDPNARNNPNFQFSYPVMYIFNRPKDLGNVIFGVNVTSLTQIISAKVLTLHSLINFQATEEMSAAYVVFLQVITDFFHSKQNETELIFVPQNLRAMDDELKEIIFTTAPFLFPATLFLVLFVVLSNVSPDRNKSKPIEAFLSIISVWLSLMCTFGLLFFLGIKFNPVASSMPFLILAIGVDDAFLLLGAWRMSNHNDDVQFRMARTMSEAGASIVITTATDFTCFVLGYILCGSPAVSDFCLMAAIGIFFDFLFQITFFSAVMVLGGRKENKGGLFGGCMWCFSSDRTIERIDQGPQLHNFMRDRYAPFIDRPEVRLISFCFYALYIVLGLYGCFSIKVDISPSKYVRDNSPIQKFVHLADKYIWADNIMPTFYVMNPPDFRNASQTVQFNRMVILLEHTPYSIGRVSTHLWLWKYQQFLTDFRVIDPIVDFYNRSLINSFVRTFDYRNFAPSIKFNYSKHGPSSLEPSIAAFTFQTSFYGLNSWKKREEALFSWRRILADFSQFDVFLANIFTPFLIDQRQSIAPSAMQTFGSAIIAMALISAVFIPNKMSIFYMTLSLLSISMGVCGFLSNFGNDLDCVSLICIVMTIGFAVDFSAHICHNFHRSNFHSPQKKLASTLESVGWPLLQAALSTMLGVVVLPLVPAYLVRVFFQTVILVCLFGLLHGLLWLPQLMSMWNQGRRGTQIPEGAKEYLKQPIMVDYKQ